MATSAVVGQKFIESLRSYANQLGDVVIDVAEAGKLHIKERTQQGIGADGQKFTQYSDNYARRKGVAVQPVTLTDTGEMLGSLYVQEGTGGAGVDTRLRGGQMRSASTGRIQSIRDVNVVIGVADEKARYYDPMDKKGRSFMGLEQLWVSENVDRFVRGITPNFVNEVTQVRVL